MRAAASAEVAVRVQTRASHDELRGARGDVLLARVCAPPVDGRANQALCRLIARELDIAPSRVAVLRGERSREKLIRVQGIDHAALQEGLGLAR